MHCSSLETEVERRKEGDLLVEVASMVVEGRIPGKLGSKSRGFHEGPHCPTGKPAQEHHCDSSEALCKRYEGYQKKVVSLWQKNIPLCVEVLLVAACVCEDSGDGDSAATEETSSKSLLLEQWYFNISYCRPKDQAPFNFFQLINAIRSQLHFSQISAWLSTENTKLSSKNFKYRISVPDETYETTTFLHSANKHVFPITSISEGKVVNVTYYSLPRLSTMPDVECEKCTPKESPVEKPDNNILDDRMHMFCTLNGKHRCEEFDEFHSHVPSTSSNVRIARPNQVVRQQNIKNDEYNRHDLNKHKNKAQVLLDAILRSGQRNVSSTERPLEATSANACESDSSISSCDKSESDIFNIRKYKIYEDNHCDSPMPIPKNKRLRDISNLDMSKVTRARQKITFDDDSGGVPSAVEQAKFRKNLDSAASMVFHSRTGLPLTSSPAPVRKGKTCFDFDSTITSVSAIKSALFSSSLSTDDDSESDGSIVSPHSPEVNTVPPQELSPIKHRRKGHSNSLLGTFEESVLNGRLKPVSTVQGFRAELGASGSFVPRHMVAPVTVFFYAFGECDKMSSPYLGHINLGRKGYNVPKSGTLQVTLFNPLGTVVKMFVIMYNLSDMPCNSQTFIRQRTLYMPADCKDENLEWNQKWLRFLIHLRFMSSKSGRIYLHSDIRMIIFRKSDLDTATAHGIDMSYELRSFIQMPSNPRYSPRK